MKTILFDIGQLATCPPGSTQDEAGLIEDAAVVIENGLVTWSGPGRELPNGHEVADRYDCRGLLVVPGLVDCHTHLCFGGWRADEFAMRMAGVSYQDIAAGGGGILGTVDKTRSATSAELVAKAFALLDGMMALGVTTVECKSGYGLSVESELKQLEVYAELERSHPVSLVPTFLGAHTVPAEYRNRRGEYIRLICEKLLPEISRRRLARFCDVFVEENAFTAEEARIILEKAGCLGLGAKIHADQLSGGGGAELAAELGAVSAEHLEFISDAGVAALAGSGTVAVSLPIASLYLGGKYLPARKLIGSGVPVAVATDFNPGSAPSYHLPLAMTLACLNQHMTPAEVLCASTTIAARAVGLGGKVGSLTAGSRADLALIDATDLNQWLYHFRPNACKAVMKDGAWRIPPA